MLDPGWVKKSGCGMNIPDHGQSMWAAFFTFWTVTFSHLLRVIWDSKEKGNLRSGSGERTWIFTFNSPTGRTKKLQQGECRKSRLIESNAKCRYLNKWPVKVFYLSKAPSPPLTHILTPPPPPTHCIRVYSSIGDPDPHVFGPSGSISQRSGPDLSLFL